MYCNPYLIDILDTDNPPNSKYLCELYVGKRIGRLTIVDYAGRVPGDLASKTYWLCRCDCGNYTIVNSYSLSAAKTNSCGCYSREVTSKSHLGPFNTAPYLMSKTRLYRIWNHMLRRCYNNKSSSYNRYGGRGITVCDEWKNDFNTFRLWALDNGYADDLSIDRINTNGNYCPENCRWTTDKVQQNNRCDNYYIAYNNYVFTAAEWGAILNVNGAMIWKRLHRGWSVYDALTTPPYQQPDGKQRVITIPPEYQKRNHYHYYDIAIHD